MRQLTDSEMNTLSQAMREYTPYYTGYEIEELQGFGTGFITGLDHAAAQLAALTADLDRLREAHQELSGLAREVSRMYSDTSWNIGAIRKLTQYIDNKDKENQNG